MAVGVEGQHAAEAFAQFVGAVGIFDQLGGDAGRGDEAALIACLRLRFANRSYASLSGWFFRRHPYVNLPVSSHVIETCGIGSILIASSK